MTSAIKMIGAPATAGQPAGDAVELASSRTTGSDGLTDWQRQKIAEMAKWFHRRYPPMRPMVSIRGLSPVFLKLAIELDVALCKYRDIASYFEVTLDVLRQFGIPSSIIDANGKEIENPFLVDLYQLVGAAMSKASDVLSKIRSTKPVTSGDKRLQAYAPNLLCCPRYRQIDALLFARDWVDRGPK